MIIYVKKNKWILTGVFISALISNLCAVRLQFFKGSILDAAIQRDSSNTFRNIILLISFILLECLFFYLYNQLRSFFTVKCVSLLREDFFQGLINKHFIDFTESNKGEYIAKYTNDLEKVKDMYFSTMTLLINLISKIILVSIALFILDIRVAVITLTLLTMPLYIPKLIEKRLKTCQMDYMASVNTNLRELTDWLANFEVIKMFSIEKKITEKYTESNNIVMKKMMNNYSINYTSNLLTMLMSYVSHFLILALSAYLVLNGNFTAGTFFVSVGLIDQLSYPIISISTALQNIVSVRPISTDMIDFINKKRIEKEDRIYKDTVIEIDIRNLSFSYNDKKLIDNFSFKFKKNKKYLIQGKSGSGKTTLINLMLNYYSDYQGEILLNKDNIKEIINIYPYVTVVRQDAALFHDTLRNNLNMYNNNISDNQIIKVLKLVNLQKYANEEALNEMVLEGGLNLSGGEKKRISVARGLLRNTDILIFDEPLANLDDDNVSNLENFLLSIEGKVLIIVSHQFSQEKMDYFDNVINLNRL